MTTTNELKCRGCGAPLTDSSDSEAHIIPNALGGRLKPKGIICRECNTELDRIADNALVQAFGSWPTLLNVPRDRGAHPDKDVSTQSGKRVRISADGTLTRVDPVYTVTAIDDGHQVEIGAGVMKTARQLLQRAAKQFPQIDVDEALQHARTIGVNDGDALKMGLDYHPRAVFGGIVSALWLYLIHVAGHAIMDWNRLLEKIRSAQRTGEKFRYMTDGLPGLVGPEVPFGHKIVVRSVPRTGELIAYVEILGVLCVGGLLAKARAPSDLIEHIYVYDLDSQSDRSGEFSISAAEFERQDWEAVGLGPADADALGEHFLSKAENVFGTVYCNRFSQATAGQTE
ncbi:HNH endonuclease [Paraburkholderia sp. A2RO-4L]|uniref:HNH endonuclease n=1 Tax=Paraburkholderia sp. A2RO-4L TaxID=3028374 RepID=UPI003DA7E7DD